jgi:AcrR family transcriptional regulator
MARTGRRRGPSTTREAILAAARRRFAEEGYAATTLRAVAADAGVDPGVVHHFFGSKDGLFQAAVGWPFDPATVVMRFFEPAPEGLGGRIVRVFLGMWDDPLTRAPLMAVLRSAMTHEASARLLREFVTHELLARVTGHIDRPDADLRGELAASHLIGVAVLRYLVQLEPIASASTETLVTWLTPAIERYLDPRAP